MSRGLLIFCLLLLASSSKGWRSVASVDRADKPEELSSKDHKTKINEQGVKTNDAKTEMLEGVNSNTNHPEDKGSKEHKEFDEFIESFFQPFHEDELNKKPKVKTVVSFAEIIGPKHVHASDPILSPFGFKEASLLDDPLLDMSRFLSFMPKLSKIDFVWPIKHNKERHIDCNNLSYSEPRVWQRHTHHISRRELKPPKHLSKTSELLDGTNIFDKYPEMNTDYSDVKVDDDVNGNEGKDTMNNLFKGLPYIEGALGGVMLVMFVVVIISWIRVRKQNTVWATIPFLDKSQCIEKV